MKRKADEMRDEYPEDLIKSGVRGDSVAVNRALRDYMELKKKSPLAPGGAGVRRGCAR